MSRTATSPPTDPRLWRLLLACAYTNSSPVPLASGWARSLCEVLRVFSRPESEIWEVLQEWAREYGRDAGEVFEHVWAPSFDKDEGE